MTAGEIETVKTTREGFSERWARTIRFTGPVFLAVAGICAADTASALPITITNPSFENTGGIVLGTNGYTSDGSGLTGWAVEASTGFVGLFRPGGSLFPSIPNGNHVAYSHGRNLSQVLTSVLTANTVYTLGVGVGQASNMAFGGYVTRLRAGSVTLIEDLNSLAPPSGEFLTSSISFTALSGNSLIGQPLEIVLDSLGSEVSFDNVQLDASSIVGGAGNTIPEPSTLALLLGGMIGALGISRRRTRFSQGSTMSPKPFRLRK